MIVGTLEALIMDALAEDVGQGDVTTNATVPASARCEARLVAKQDGIVSGIRVFQLVFELLDPDITHWESLSDTEHFVNGDTIARFQGNARAVLTGERTALNFIQRLSGIATYTESFVKAVEGLTVRICDTRKTTPLLRQLEKRAVVHGGATNHRYALFDGVVIKENHIVAAGGITEAVKQVVKGTHHLLKIEVEVTNLTEFDEAVRAGADAILMDNMPADAMREAVKRVNGRSIILEASGNITLNTVREVAETGVHVLSIGALTHSAHAVDLSLLIANV